MNLHKPLSPALTHGHAGFIGIQAGLFLILLALVAHIGYLTGQSYEFQPIVFTGLSIIIMLPPLAYLSLAAHYNNAIFLAIAIYGVVHLTVLPGTPYMLIVAKSLWWIGAGLALAGYGVLAYRFLFKKDGTKTPPRPGAPVLDIPRRDFPVPLAYSEPARRSASQAAAALRSGNSAGPQWLDASRGEATADYAPSLRSPWRAASD